MSVHYPDIEKRQRIAQEQGFVYPPENTIVILQEDRESNILGVLPQLKARLGDPKKTNTEVAKEMTEKLGATVSVRQVSKWRNRQVTEVTPNTSMPPRTNRKYSKRK